MSGERGRIAVVTGAARGIGRAIADRLASAGATVVVADLDVASAEEAAKQLGGGAIGVGVDVADLESVQATVSRVCGEFGRIDVLVNNAGWDKAERFVESDPADWERIVRINLFGVLNTCKTVLPVMIEQGGGAVVNIASDAGRVGSSGEAVYSAAKGGIIAFTKTIARETARHQVTANAVCPGPTDTALFASIGGPGLRESLAKAIPLRRIGTPEDVAGAVAFLTSGEAGYITGQTLSVSGGLTMS
ncbi:SDR family NAD(P)-dependent oxidoreductase [Amycolatopsis sp. Poz14]|uniref:SDR family NAD(P)-dependent oxidoreductase n=1 Tax=Amycolatopsis sp. Poz14 TaxID=1447705 RepID=UPI001EE85D6E|nr:3-oxoacyl-ACP reductase family protein [Amycolatopsis sp. Poz14]MCG3753947.1 3-oxoacyl-ACP reductase FabG [Amycolatopsis sp. Poz14]